MTNDHDHIFLVVSSELICKVMEGYFRRELFKKYVSVVDLNALEKGYGFTLAVEEDDGQLALPLVFTPEANGAVKAEVKEKKKAIKERAHDTK